MNEASRYTETGVHYNIQHCFGPAAHSDRPQYPPFDLVVRQAGATFIFDGLVDSYRERLPEYSDGMYSDPRLMLIFSNRRGFLERTP